MTCNYPTAIDDINGILYVAWQAGASAIAGYTPELRWQNIEKTSPPDNARTFGIMTSDIISEEPSALSSDPKNKRFTAVGQSVFALYCPRSDENSAEYGKRLAELVKNAYRAKRSDNGVIFRNARVQNINGGSLFYRWNVVIEFTYDEIRSS